MKNKLMLFALATASLFFTLSCDNRKDQYMDIDGKPSISMYKKGVLIETASFNDSLKIGISYPLTYQIQDEETLTLQNAVKNGNASVTVNGVNIFVSSQSDGSCVIEFFAKDSFDKESVFKLNLTVFTNLKPIAHLKITKIGLESPYEYEFDGSGSFDKDKNFGGLVTDYTFSLQNYVVNTQNSKIRYIFGSAGQKLIKLKVKDNNGEWSEEISEYINI